MAIIPIINVLTFDVFTEDLKKYKISIFKSEDENLIIKAIYKNVLIVKEFSMSYTLKKLKNIHIFNLFDSIDDCALFISDTLESNKVRNINCKLKEEGNKGILTIPIRLGKLNEIEFELLEKEKKVKNSEDNKSLELINKIYNENKELKTEIENLKKDKENTSSKLNKIYHENNELKTEIENLKKDKENTSSKLNKIYHENNELKTEIENLKKDKENTSSELKTEIENLKTDKENTSSELNKIYHENNELKSEIERLLSRLNTLEIEFKDFSKMKNEQIENLFIDSIIVNKNENRMIYNWINENNITCKLLYRASINGDSSTSFHSCCDGKGPTITFIKINDGKRIGGFTKVSWSSTFKGYKTDPDSFIFSLDTCQKHDKIQNKNKFAVCHYSNSGPTFGEGHDIFISCGCKSNSKSYCNSGITYKLISSMTPENIYYFQVIDYEVYSIQINK